MVTFFKYTGDYFGYITVSNFIKFVSGITPAPWSYRYQLNTTILAEAEEIHE
jgi:hypothetical protein